MIEYCVKNTALAAYLISEGIELLRTDYSDIEDVAFLFSDNNEHLQTLVQNWETGIAKSRSFYQAYKYIINQIAIRRRR